MTKSGTAMMQYYTRHLSTERRGQMGEKEINRYLALVGRRLFILTHCGVDWRPEYETEMAAISKEIAELRKLVDQEHERRACGRYQGNKELPVLS